MKSLVTLLFSHIFVSIFITFVLFSGHITRPFLIIFLLFLPLLNKGQILQKIQSKKRRLLNVSLCFILVSLPQLTLISINWKYYILLTIAILSSITYLYYLYQFVKETK